MGKKVLIISQNFYPDIGSAGNRMKNIFKLLVEKGYEVEVITTEPSYPNKKLYEDKMFWDDEFLDAHTSSIKRVKVANRKYARSVWNRLMYYLEVMLKMIFYVIAKRQRQFDIVFVSSPPIFIGAVGLLAKFSYKSKLILDVRDLWPESLNGVQVFNYPIVMKLSYAFERTLYKKSDHIIVNSLGFTDYIHHKAGIPLSKIDFMPNSAMSEEVAEIDLKEEGPFKVIYTGNIGLAQDLEVLKKLAVTLDEHKIALSIVGYGFRRNELKSFVRENKLSNVKFYSPLTRKGCFSLNRKHHVGFVSLNSNEVFDTVLPGKIIDYMTCQLPIVASVGGFSKEFIESNQIGFVSENRDVNEIVDYILKLNRNPELRNRIAMKAGNYIRSNFMWENNINILINSMERLFDISSETSSPKLEEVR